MSEPVGGVEFPPRPNAVAFPGGNGYEPDRPAKILIVDDHESNRRILRGILGKEGYEIAEASDGAQGIDAALRENPDLVLLDIMMPLKNGFEVCTELKRDERSRNIPIVFISALSQAAGKVKGLELGAVDYITKPFDPVEVLARVRNQVKIWRLKAELLSAYQELLERQDHIDEDLRAAATIQQSLVPKSPPPLNGLDVVWRFHPSDCIGGDIFNLLSLGDGSLALYVADVSGHGVPAAMLTVALTQSLSLQGGIIVSAPPENRIASPAAVLSKLDDEYPLERFNRHLTLSYCLVHSETRRLCYSSAGHPPPVLLRPDGTMRLLEAGGSIIGLGARVPFEEETVDLVPGDRIFLYTDGVTEYEGDGDIYGDDRFFEALRRTRSTPLALACNSVIDSLTSFGGGRRPRDDVTLVGVELQQPASRGG
jgi:sigma-B regulation protein RsbU (phosphoserine phosphatase)